jgi:hypothetical protein
MCHECGRDNSNNMRNGGWLDNYNDGGPLPSNYNDAQASYPPAFVGEGTFNGPMFNNGAVNGQFQQGGYVPITMPDLRHPGGSDVQGFKAPIEPTLSKKQVQDIVANNKALAAQQTIRSAKKLTKAEQKKSDAKLKELAQQQGNDFVNGRYEEGLLNKMADSKLANNTWNNLVVPGMDAAMIMEGAGAVTALGKKLAQKGMKKLASNLTKDFTTELSGVGLENNEVNPTSYFGTKKFYTPDQIEDIVSKNFYTYPEKIQTTQSAFLGDFSPVDKTPFGQPIPKGGEPILNLPEGQILHSDDLANRLPPEDLYKHIKLNNPYKGRVPKKAMGGSIPGTPGFTYARTSSTPSKGPHRNKVYKTDASAQNGQEMSYYQHGLDWKPKMISKNGSWLNKYDEKEVIKDDRGQWDHPGKITEINSNQITMKGVPYDVLGISDTGHTQLMHPGEEYKFKGKKVTEYPMAKNGLRQEQKSLVNLDQLTNFTNYNTPQPGGWMDKYTH